MGLTHYWERESELEPAAFRNAVTDIQRVVSTLPCRLAGKDGTGSPLFTGNAVVFNGAAGTGWEPFEIHRTQLNRHGRKRFFEYVKTNHAPYDIAIKVSLICLKHHLGAALKVTSDAPDAGWAEARMLCCQALGYGDAFAIER